MNRKSHWENAYQIDDPTDVSWFQTRPDISLELIATCTPNREAAIIDVGGGASTLVDHLLSEGYSHLTVLDVSSAALHHARVRLGGRARLVNWLEADVTDFRPEDRHAIWHDRAVFHFLTAAEDRRKYLGGLRRALEPGGYALIATFALDGPSKCSGLEVVRYDLPSIAAEFGPEFVIRDTRRESHTTPWESTQSFECFLFQRESRPQ